MVMIKNKYIKKNKYWLLDMKLSVCSIIQRDNIDLMKLRPISDIYSYNSNSFRFVFHSRNFLDFCIEKNSIDCFTYAINLANISIASYMIRDIAESNNRLFLEELLKSDCNFSFLDLVSYICKRRFPNEKMFKMVVSDPRFDIEMFNKCNLSSNKKKYLSSLIHK